MQMFYENIDIYTCLTTETTNHVSFVGDFVFEIAQAELAYEDLRETGDIVGIVAVVPS